MTRPILIVEDDYDIRELFAESLEEAGYAVATACNGREALDRLRAAREPELPAVILLDLMMPVMDGWALREELLRDPALGRIPIVVMTASRHFGDVGDDVLLKPFELGELIDTVGRHAPAS